MAEGQYQDWPARPARPSVDARSVWTGGASTAVVSALVAIVGVLIIRGVLGIPVIAPGDTGGAIDYVGAVWLAGFAVVGSLLATAIAHVLLLVSPRPMLFFAWIVGLATIGFVVWPFSVAVSTEVRIASAALYLVIGIAIGSLLTGAARGAVRRPPRTGWTPQ